MKVQYASDLHLEIKNNSEWLKKNPIIPVADILVLAGDITKLRPSYYSDTIFDYFSENWDMVIMIPGNHEYYNNKDYNVINKNSLNIDIRKNVKLLNNIIFKYKGTNFICTTLWSYLSVANAWIITQSLNDFRVIKHKVPGTKIPQILTADYYNKFHSDAKKFLFKSLENLKGQKNVVVTHHAPTQKVNHPDFKGDSINDAFIVELFDWIYDFDISYWIYGHTHRNINTEINGTSVITNQLGYVGYNDTFNYESDKFFKL